MNKTNIQFIKSSDFPIKLSSKAISMGLLALKEMKNKENNILRICVIGGGCSGLKYILKFVKKINYYDLYSEKDGLKIAIDIFSSCHLNGAQIDYIENENGAGFKFITKNVSNSCACDSSTATK